MIFGKDTYSSSSFDVLALEMLSLSARVTGSSVGGDTSCSGIVVYPSQGCGVITTLLI